MATREAAMRARELDDRDRAAVLDVLAGIEALGVDLAAKAGADIRVEKAQGGKLPYLTFRGYGVSPQDSPAESELDTPHH
jgi:hypothetical protein